ncbi:S-adenosyl-L-methionine-dependent methyltransferase [Clavulina sp. PMI_390]|nr:S-adenosyl-L-methionine-dependent methyltransferase [Clavulina sp. PMI_390]
MSAARDEPLSALACEAELKTPKAPADHEVNPYGGDFDWNGYANLRPTYPLEIFDAIYKFHTSGRDSWDAVLDVACGPGTGPTRVLTDRFRSVIAYDRNSEQLALGRESYAGNEGIRFVEGEAEDLSLIESKSVDMITCFTALHWIDARKFFPEAARVLKPGGTLVAGSYHTMGSTPDPQINAILRALEIKSMDATLPPPETSFISRWYRECARSHYDSIEVPAVHFSHETRLLWNLQDDLYYSQYSPLPSVDRRNKKGVGYEERIAQLDAINSEYTKEQFLALLYTLDHYQKEDSNKAVEQIWDILRPGEKLQMTRPVEFIFARSLLEHGMVAPIVREHEEQPGGWFAKTRGWLSRIQLWSWTRSSVI